MKTFEMTRKSVEDIEDVMEQISKAHAVLNALTESLDDAVGLSKEPYFLASVAGDYVFSAMKTLQDVIEKDITHKEGDQNG